MSHQYLEAVCIYLGQCMWVVNGMFFWPCFFVFVCWWFTSKYECWNFALKQAKKRINYIFTIVLL